MMKGHCCRKYWIPVTHLDLYRLAMYENIDVYSVVDFKDARIYDARGLYPPIKIGNGMYYLALNDRDGAGCIFLDPSGRCRVHMHKPLVCRFYPFAYIVSENGIHIDVNENAIGECPGIVLDGKPVPPEIAEPMKRIAIARIRELELWRNVIELWNNLVEPYMDFEDFIDYALDVAEEHYKILVKQGMWIP